MTSTSLAESAMPFAAHLFLGIRVVGDIIISMAGVKVSVENA
jgi:hypothetical protein